jgi:hypothetical protein
MDTEEPLNISTLSPISQSQKLDRKELAKFGSSPLQPGIIEFDKITETKIEREARGWTSVDDFLLTDIAPSLEFDWPRISENFKSKSANMVRKRWK